MQGSTLKYCLDTGAQPLLSEDGKQVLAVNGEIYNHIALRKSVGTDVKFRTHSDCEVILSLVSLYLHSIYAPFSTLTTSTVQET